MHFVFEDMSLIYIKHNSEHVLIMLTFINLFYYNNNIRWVSYNAYNNLDWNINSTANRGTTSGKHFVML